ncbi:MAG: Stf0 family sulfotransferase [Reyranella sp.]|uniref:Stf0 family sulfotransferase n=1 Tax=Reyranella sp. TaxID=1929291 RepID=UPI0027307849|nr:Stf0 family sulfotransferase [Reyranella sp.]MDP1966548.1 Stf0 family sulfotransferase [Reyranella sp.]MDP2372764.1 Stf0 family sulfotransferase [Reyranella sp.]
MTDQDLDRIFEFPISRHVNADRAVSSDCSEHLRALQRRISVLAISRSGSEYLSSLLGSLGIEAHEYLTPRSSVSRGHTIREDQEPAEFLGALCRRVPNRILCLKVNLQALMPLFEIGEFPAHMHDWRFIHLTRANVVKQAISLHLAEKTGVWRNDLKAARPLYHEDVTFAAIASQLEQVFQANQWLDRFIGLFGLTPLRIVYEDLQAAPEHWLGRIADFLELSDVPRDRAIDRVSARSPRRQSTPLNLHIEAAFRAEMQHRLQTGRASRDLLLPEPESGAPPTAPVLPRRPLPVSTASAQLESNVGTRMRITCVGNFEKEIGRCWLYRLPDSAEAIAFEGLADHEGAPESSPLCLYENDILLGPAHAAHALIRHRGGGAYSHWKSALYFSTSDNSDPNRNGRRYEIGLG